jgi:GNAT superfamily N-acetyltransferase
VRHLYVLADWRRRGVGRQLVEAVVAEARLHFDRLTLWTNDAAPFYRALGFIEDGTLFKATHHMKLQ